MDRVACADGPGFQFWRLVLQRYLVMLAPSVAALVGIGFVAMWSAYARHAWRGMILPAALLVGGIIQIAILWSWLNWNG